MQISATRSTLTTAWLLCGLVIGTGCTVDVNVILPGIGTGLAVDETSSTTGVDESGDDLVGDGDGETETEDETDDESLGASDESLDQGDGEGLVELSCVVSETGSQIDAPLPCNPGPTSNAIAPVIAWTWTGRDGEDSVLATPLVANLDDDNFDGAVDLCDTPNVIVIAVDLSSGKADPIPAGHLVSLDGRTGAVTFLANTPLDATATPAVADLDGDGVPEILAFARDAAVQMGQVGDRRVVALRADGSVLWMSDTIVSSAGGGAIAIADLDADGSPEILAPEHVLSAEGEFLWAPPEPPLAGSLPIAADLDLDGQLEVLFGGSVYTGDGELLFDLDLPGGKNSGAAAIANFDDDDFPEIYVQSSNHRILEHDGSAKAQCPGGAGHPVAIEDLDGDGKAEILSAHLSWFSALTIVDDSCVTVWSSKIDDPNASSSGTAFDLLGDGAMRPIFADLEWVRVFDPAGVVIAEIPRKARASNANPVVVDADNDGAAEIVLVGSEPVGGDEPGLRPSVLLVQNLDDAFAPTRRIWNQHAYHGTNIREDGQVPVNQPMQWLEANSFRTNIAPGYAGPLCQAPTIR